MATLRELKGRIGSVASSEKITGAMKMISSAKMRKEELALRRLLPFRTQIETVISNLLSADAEFTSPLTQEREVHRMAIIVFGSDDGLCGAYNVNVFKLLLEHISTLRSELPAGETLDIDIYPVGAKISKACGKLSDPKIRVIESGEINSKSGADAVRSFSKSIVESFLQTEYDRVDNVYMKFRSVSRQTATVEQFIPVVADTFVHDGMAKTSGRPYIFEPSPEAIFRSILPMFLLSVMQEIFTENRAYDQAARIMAIQSANDNANKLLEQLQLEYNKLRQQSITNELLDIVGGQVR
ncbi:MAG: ATP synthase F1 subunit gamma [Muribaculaceae bacterium]|nr:ATP synthase F1 subunit gamma [Muribaculaceae bacterium]